jgi:hypothetical protein
MKRMAAHIRKLRKEGEFDKSQFYEGKFSNFMNDFNTLLKEFNRSSDEVETLTGDRMLEKYKASVAKSWGGKHEKDDNIKPLTTEEVTKKMSGYEQRREELAAKRQTQLALKAAERLAIEAPQKQRGEGQAASAPTPAEEEAGSEEEDEDIIERVIVKNDPNTGKHESKIIRDRFEAAKKIRDAARAKATQQPAKPKSTRPKIEDMDLKDLDDINKYHNQTLDSGDDTD